MFLKGSSDISNFRADLYGMLTGSLAAMQRGGGQASNGAQVVGADAWTALDGTNFVIRSQRTESPFTAEYGMYRGMPRFAARNTGTVFAATFQTQIGKPTFSGAYNGGTARVYFAAFVLIVNTAPGNLSGTQVSYILVNADTGATVTSGTVTGWSGSTSTQAVAQGVSLTLTLGGGESFVAGTNAVMWLRAYTTTFTQGIDYFPEAPKVSNTLTVSNSSGGSNNYTAGGTDYTLVQQVHVFPQVSTTTGYFDAGKDWGGTGAGCGIAWNAGGAPPAAGTNYFIPATYSIYGAYYQVPNVVALTNFSLTGAPMDVWDATLGNGRWVLQNNAGTPKTTINTTLSYAQLFTGAAQAGSTFINFWISVKQDKIVMAFRGDPGQTGRLVVLTFQRMTSLVGTVDKLPWVFLPDGSTASGSTSGAFHVTSKLVYEQPYYGNPAVSIGNLTLAMFYGPGATVAIVTTGIVTTSPGLPAQNPNNFDLRWWFYAIYANHNFGGSNLVGTFDASRPSGIRGKLQGLYVVASNNFTSLDELVDASGTYLLMIPTSIWGNTTSWTAITLLEE